MLKTFLSPPPPNFKHWLGKNLAKWLQNSKNWFETIPFIIHFFPSLFPVFMPWLLFVLFYSCTHTPVFLDCSNRVPWSPFHYTNPSRFYAVFQFTPIWPLFSTRITFSPCMLCSFMLYYGLTVICVTHKLGHRLIYKNNLAM